MCQMLPKISQTKASHEMDVYLSISSPTIKTLVKFEERKLGYSCSLVWGSFQKFGPQIHPPKFTIDSKNDGWQMCLSSMSIFGIYAKIQTSIHPISSCPSNLIHLGIQKVFRFDSTCCFLAIWPNCGISPT